MNWEPIRDFSKLSISRHAVLNRIRQRNIGHHEMKRAIEDGSVEEGSDETSIKYRLDMPGVDLIVAVNIPDANITTAFYDNEQGANNGRL